MKAKTIKSALRWKINDWIKSIDDEELRKLAQKNVIVTGGSIVSMLTGEKVNDYDVYFRTVEAASRIANYYVDKFLKEGSAKHDDIQVITTGAILERYQPGDIGTPSTMIPAVAGSVKIFIKSNGVAREGHTYEYNEGMTVEESHSAYMDSLVPETVNDVESAQQDLELTDDVPAEAIEAGGEGKPKYRPVFVSANAITLSDGVQLVVRFIGEPEVIHKFYDFVHCTCYWQSWDGVLVLPAAALEAIITKELRYVGSLYPLCSIIRIRKFVARGWHINAGQILKMCVQLGELDLKDINVLQDQLTGVDAFYFMQVLERLREYQKEKGDENAPIDTTYLMTIIDRMF